MARMLPRVLAYRKVSTSRGWPRRRGRGSGEAAVAWPPQSDCGGGARRAEGGAHGIADGHAGAEAGAGAGETAAGICGGDFDRFRRLQLRELAEAVTEDAELRALVDCRFHFFRQRDVFDEEARH